VRGRLITRKIFRSDAQTTRETLKLLRNAESSLYQLQGVLVIALELSEAPSSGEEHGLDFYEQVQRFEMLLIKGALRHAHGSQTRAAELLHLNLSTLNTKIRTYRIECDDFK
jgi:DNA-binding NtrC family response regulator